jgi:hypothetical protein
MFHVPSGSVKQSVKTRKPLKSINRKELARTLKPTYLHSLHKTDQHEIYITRVSLRSVLLLVLLISRFVPRLWCWIRAMQRSERVEMRASASSSPLGDLSRNSPTTNAIKMKSKVPVILVCVSFLRVYRGVQGLMQTDTTLHVNVSMERANDGKDLESTMVDPGSVLTGRAMSSAILPQQTIPLNKLLTAPVDKFQRHQLLSSEIASEHNQTIRVGVLSESGQDE